MKAIEALQVEASQKARLPNVLTGCNLSTLCETANLSLDSIGLQYNVFLFCISLCDSPSNHPPT